MHMDRDNQGIRDVVEGDAEIVLAASIFHFSILSIREIKEYLESKGLKVHHEKEVFDECIRCHFKAFKH